MASNFTPSWVYGPDGKAKLVSSQAEQDALGKGPWHDSPSKHRGQRETAPSLETAEAYKAEDEAKAAEKAEPAGVPTAATSQ